MVALPGSLIVTQMERSEANLRKGFLQIDVGGRAEVKFIPLKNVREFFYEDIELTPNETVRSQIEHKLNQILYSKNFSKPPLIKLRIKGQSTDLIEQELREIERRYKEKAIISFVKELESPEITEKIEFLRNLKEQKVSVAEIGSKVLREVLREQKFRINVDIEQLLSLLSEGEVDKAFNLLVDRGI
jgi:DNA repair exonuclease SbcCD nuclease subunit